LTLQQITPGWATYLRVSDEDKQTPERSFAMQRQRIQEQLLSSSNTPQYREYTDLLSGTTANRKDYQQMLSDAETGKFSYIGLYRADRFGRNTVEGLQAATKLISLGIKIGIANMPGLQPENPDGFFMFLIQMGMAQREVDVLAQRTTDGIEAKLRAGGWPNKAPEGYLNKERQVSSNKYERWVEADPKYIQPLREAWEMLLTARYTLDQICEELSKRGYTRTTGRPWAWNTPKRGKRVTAKNRLHEIFHKPFYAGWAVSEKFDIKIGEVRGKWEPVVTTKQFERGIEILRKHGHNKSREKRQYYHLRNLLWVQAGGKKYKMHGSTPSGRNKSYSYYITHAELDGKIVRVRTNIVDEQIKRWVAGVAVDPERVPEIQDAYHSQINRVTRKDREKTLDSLKRRFSALKEEEARLGRLFMTGQISEAIYAKLRSEWYEKKIHTQLKIEELEIDLTQYLDDLEVALVLMSKISVLYGRLGEEQKNNFL
jgi:DNA invertase Pin-like site-specific DNA recombinase